MEDGNGNMKKIAGSEVNGKGNGLRMVDAAGRVGGLEQRVIGDDWVCW